MPVMSNYSDMPSEDREISALSLPPHSTEAEQSVLGGLMLENSAWDRIADVVSGEDFYRHELPPWFFVPLPTWLTKAALPTSLPFKKVWNAMKRWKQQADSTIWLHWRKTRHPLPISAATPKSCENVPSCASLPKSARKLRVAHTIPKGAMQVSFWTRRKTKYSKLPKVPPNPNKASLEMPDLLKEVVERIDMLYSRDNPDEVTGISTGFIDLDKNIRPPTGRFDHRRRPSFHG